MPYLGLFHLEFLKTLVKFEISPLIFVKFKNLAKKQNYINLGPKIPYLGIFGLAFSKTIVRLEISTLKFVKFQNFPKKQNYLNLRRKNVLFGYFWERSLKTYCHI